MACSHRRRGQDVRVGGVNKPLHFVNITFLKLESFILLRMGAMINLDFKNTL